MFFLNIQSRIRRTDDLVNAHGEPFAVVLADDCDVIVLAAAVLAVDERAAGGVLAFDVDTLAVGEEGDHIKRETGPPAFQCPDAHWSR